MNRAEKIEAVQKLNVAFSETPHVILASFQGLTVNQASDLRRRVRSIGGGVRVVKNRLAKRAAVGTSVAQMADRLVGPCLLAAHPTDPVGLAKVLAGFSKDNPQLEFLAGVLEGRDLLNPQGIKQLATLPGLDELRAQLLSVVQAPAGQLVRLLATPGGQLARVLDARREKMEQENGAQTIRHDSGTEPES